MADQPFAPRIPKPTVPRLKLTVPGFKLALFGLIALAVLFIWAKSFVVVQAGERAVIFSRLTGVKPDPLAEGLHPLIPVIWEPVVYDTKTQTYTMTGSKSESHEASTQGDDALVCLTSEGLPVTLDASVRFHPDPQQVASLHSEIGPNYVDSVVRPEARSVIRTVFAEYPVVAVYSGQRQKIVEKIAEDLSAKLRENYVILDEVLVRDVRFRPLFQQAIEQKQVAQQEAQKMVFELDQARSEAQRKVIEAQGEAAAIGKRASALARNPQLVAYEYVQGLPEKTRIVVSDSKSILNLGDLLTSPPRPSEQQAAPEGGQQ
jgi:regulator of protease activity HflC (stomatin/prohibitin superfamily)